MERKLATIQVILELRPIPNADKIEVAIVKGWECVVKKGEFVVGEKIIYVEVDSVMPDKPEYEFLRDRKFRVRTIKLRGQVSQGLVLSISTLWNYNELPHNWANKPVDTDVTELLGITKYLSPSERDEFAQQERKIANEKNKLKKFLMRYSWFRKLFLSRKQKSRFPYWVGKTDEPRIQNLHWNEFYENYKDKEVYVTEKIDYQSVTFTGKMIPKFKWLKLPTVSGYKKEQLIKMKQLGKSPFVIILPNEKRYTISTSKEQVESRSIGNVVKSISWFKFMIFWYIVNLKWVNKFQFVVCSRNLTTNDKGSLYWKVARKYNIEEILKKNPTLTIQGEQGDTKVQGNKYGITEPTMWVFNIIDHEKNYHYNYFEMGKFCVKHNLQIVPYLQINKLSEFGSTVQELVEFSKGKSVLADIPREGIVVRCVENGKKIFSFKAISSDFLLKYD